MLRKLLGVLCLIPGIFLFVFAMYPVELKGLFVGILMSVIITFSFALMIVGFNLFINNDS